MGLKNEVETAFAAVIQALPSLPSGTFVYTGEDNEEQVRPCVVCHCQGGPEEPQGSGNRMMTVEIICKSQVEDPQDPNAGDSVVLHSALAKVIEGLKQDDLGAQLTAASAGKLFVFDPVVDEGQSADPQGRAFTDTQVFKAYCCAANLA